jgi:hypothetical protein
VGCALCRRLVECVDEECENKRAREQESARTSECVNAGLGLNIE